MGLGKTVSCIVGGIVLLGVFVVLSAVSVSPCST